MADLITKIIDCKRNLSNVQDEYSRLCKMYLIMQSSPKAPVLSKPIDKIQA